jgi:3-oxoacyl-[acyl-carrier-protein] synthase III
MTDTELHVVGTGRFLPGAPVSNQKIEEVFSIRADWIDFMIGTKSRHLVLDLDTKRVEYRLADLCERAARQALEAAELDARDIDVIVMSTATPEDLIPATVNVVADRIGLNCIPTFQIQAGCSGAIQCLAVAASFLKAGSARNALVVAGDACYRYIDFSRDFKKAPAAELVNVAIFGEAAGAAVLSANRSSKGMRIVRLLNRFEGLGRDAGHIMRWFGSAPAPGDAKPSESAGAWEDYKAVEKSVPGMAAEALAEILTGIGKEKQELDYFLPPQLGGHMTKRIVSALGMDHGKVVSCVADIGNCGNAMPLIQLDMLAERMAPSETAVAIAIESSKWLKTGLALTRN